MRLPNLKDVLLYHVLGEKLLTTDLMNRNSNSVTTLKSDGQTISITNGATNIILVDQQSDKSNIGLADVQAKNGVANVIDQVLIPLFDSVYQVATLLDDYSMLVELVQKADLVNALTGPGPFTVFAPRNDAFVKLMSELMINFDDILNLPMLDQVLLYHVVGDYLLSSALDDKNGQNLVTLRDDKQSIKINSDSYNDYLGFAVRGIELLDNQNDYDIFIGNVETKNGVVFVIDRVMIPLFDSIIQVATSFDDYSILVKLVIAAELTDTLTNDGPFTVFAPNNYAFDKLLLELQISIDDVINLPNLKDILYYHILSGYYLSYDLETKEFETLKSDKQTISINTDQYFPTQGFAISGIDITDQNHDTKISSSVTLKHKMVWFMLLIVS